MVSTYFSQFPQLHIRLQFSEAYVRLKEEKRDYLHSKETCFPLTDVLVNVEGVRSKEVVVCVVFLLS